MSMSLKFAGFLLLLVASLLAGCNPGPDPAPTPADVNAIVEAASEAVSQAESFRVIIERQGAPVYIDTSDTSGVIEFMRAEADYAAPNRIRAEVKIKISGLVAGGTFIAIGADQYLANATLTGGRWWQYDFVPGLDPAAILAEDGGLRAALRTMHDLELVGVEDVDGAQSYHVRGTGNGRDVGSLTLGLIGGEDVAVDAWIRADDMRVVRVAVVEPNRPLPDGVDEPPSWTIELYDYGAAVEIEAPADYVVSEATPAPTAPGTVPGQGSH